jgi:general secretion pathway protein M
MNAWLPPKRLRPILAAASYALVILVLLILAGGLAASLYDQSAETVALRERLHALEGRSAAGTKGADTGADAETGSPLIEGATLTQAGAALQQRMERAVTRAGGTLLSSEVALADTQGTPGFLSLTADLELPEAALQTLLYDLEAGMPYLFVDVFSARTPEANDDAKARRLHVALSVSGKWEARP